MNKEGGVADRYFAAQMFDYVNEIVNSVLGEKWGETERDMQKLHSSLTKELESLGQNVQKAINSETKDKKDEAIKAVDNAISKIQVFSEEIDVRLKGQTDMVLEGAQKKVAKVFDNVEKFKGDKGDKGDEGLPGTNGSPDTPRQVVEKVNKSKSKVKLSAVEGLWKS